MINTPISLLNPYPVLYILVRYGVYRIADSHEGGRLTWPCIRRQSSWNVFSTLAPPLCHAGHGRSKQDGCHTTLTAPLHPGPVIDNGGTSGSSTSCLCSSCSTAIHPSGPSVTRTAVWSASSMRTEHAKPSDDPPSNLPSQPALQEQVAPQSTLRKYRPCTLSPTLLLLDHQPPCQPRQHRVRMKWW